MKPFNCPNRKIKVPCAHCGSNLDYSQTYAYKSTLTDNAWGLLHKECVIKLISEQLNPSTINITVAGPKDSLIYYQDVIREAAQDFLLKSK